MFLEVEAGRVQEVANLVAGKPEVGYVGLTTGDRDISIQLFAASVESLYDFVTDELGRIPGVVRHRRLSFPKLLKTHFDFLGADAARNGAPKSRQSRLRHERTALRARSGAFEQRSIHRAGVRNG